MFANVVKHAMDTKAQLVLVHEQDPAMGGCPFQEFFGRTPDVLQRLPYKIFDLVAVPLYPALEHRKISLRRVLLNMGASSPGSSALHRLSSSSRLLLHRAKSAPRLLKLPMLAKPQAQTDVNVVRSSDRQQTGRSEAHTKVHAGMSNVL